MFIILDKFTSEHWLALICFILLVTWGIAIFLFGRISVKHIEREMAKEGLSPPVFDNGFYSSGITYALIMVHPNLKPTIVDYEAVRRHTRKKDKSLALFYTISSLALFTVMFIAYFLYGHDA